MTHETLALVWLGILCLTLFNYLLHDSSWLVACAYLPFLSKEKQKTIVTGLMPLWDINQTWLVFTLAGLYAGFSKGFALVMQTLYLPMIYLFLLMMCRGASLEFTIKTKLKRSWVAALALSSAGILVTLAIALALFVDSLHTSTEHSLFLQLGYWCGGFIVFLLFALTRRSPAQQTKLLAIMTVLSALSFLLIYIRYFSVSLSPVATAFIFCTGIATLCSNIIIPIQKRQVRQRLTLGFLFACALLLVSFSYPYLFTAKMSILMAASSKQSLAVCITASLIMLPLLFIVNKRFSTVYKTKLNELS